jgi:hypothetical protein
MHIPKEIAIPGTRNGVKLMADVPIDIYQDLQQHPETKTVVMNAHTAQRWATPRCMPHYICVGRAITINHEIPDDVMYINCVK